MARRREGHVFISYKREEAEAARRLKDALEADGFTTWWDVDIQTGKQWAQELDDAVRSATAIVVLWSKRSVKSKWVAHEASAAVARDNYAPVRIDLVAIPTPYDRVQATDLVDWAGNTSSPGYVLLLQRLEALVPVSPGWKEALPAFWGNTLRVTSAVVLLTLWLSPLLIHLADNRVATSLFRSTQAAFSLVALYLLLTIDLRFQNLR